MSRLFTWWKSLKPKTVGLILMGAGVLTTVLSWIFVGVMLPIAVIFFGLGTIMFVKAARAE